MSLAVTMIEPGSLRKGDLLMASTLLGTDAPVFDGTPVATHVVTSVRRDGTVYIKPLRCIGVSRAWPYTYEGRRDASDSVWLERPISVAFARVDEVTA